MLYSNLTEEGFLNIIYNLVISKESDFNTYCGSSRGLQPESRLLG